MNDLVARWLDQQQELVERLRALGAEHHDYRADLANNRFWWQDAYERPSVVASTRVLGSWALSNHSLLAAWQNSSLPENACVKQVPGVPAEGRTHDEEEVWTWAWRIADGSGAEFVYRVVTPQSWIFLGLWDLRAATATDEPPPPPPPWPNVRMVLEELSHRDVDEVRVLARNYGRSFMTDPVHRRMPWQDQLRAVGERLIALADAPPAAWRAGVAALLAQVRTFAS